MAESLLPPRPNLYNLIANEFRTLSAIPAITGEPITLNWFSYLCLMSRTIKSFEYATELERKETIERLHAEIVRDAGGTCRIIPFSTEGCQ